ncbi:MAG: hypothetical protein RBG13Loki_0409 [Promethearchaeota archaeon CR_4]|nr:MAG: hypothetical protein RBG13Loki_0409 [Candidatus Lokiarchaeota archaeon CR_4]
MDKLTKILLVSSLSVGAPLATVFQTDWMGILWPLLGWLAVGCYFLIQVFLPVLTPLGSWLKDIIDYISTFFESSPTMGATVIYIVITVVIIVVSIIVNMYKSKPGFVEELEAKYDRPPDTVK